MIHKFRRGKKLSYRERDDCSFISFDQMASKLDCVCIPCGGEMLVSVGDRVKIGTPLSDDHGFITHSSLSGQITDISDGVVSVKNDGKCERVEEIPFGLKTGKILSELDFDEFVKTVAAGGITEGESGVRTHTLLEKSYKKAKTLVVNAVCTEENDVTSLSIVTSRAQDIIAAMKIIMSVMGITEGLIVLSGKSRRAYDSLSRMTEGSDIVRCERLSAKYPQQNPALIVYALSGMELSPLHGSAEAGYLVLSAVSCLDIYELFAKGRTSCTDLVSVAGKGNELYLCEMPRGVIPEDIKRIFGIKGALFCSSPLSKIPFERGTHARLTRICEACSLAEGTGVCSRCGECDRVCPMYLFPSEFMSNGSEMSKKKGINVCIECGLCEEVCPAHFPLLSGIRKAKADITYTEGDAQ